MKKIPFEMLCWMGALCYLAGIDPAAEHLNLCVFRYLDFKWCPGCGLGHSMSFFLHGDFSTSFREHPMGGPAVLILMWRTGQLVGAATGLSFAASRLVVRRRPSPGKNLKNHC
ncbi:MAG: DUF2752 domain-containing protein [Bacteroidia bacterium]|nr:DUF2752 domain-containing protein [Bacteroidia bacterium]